ncbi:MAG: 50S ribosomal protein L19 [Patescibacteria group bacterium]|jgi:large subunit ribosomal protein L19
MADKKPADTQEKPVNTAPAQEKVILPDFKAGMTIRVHQRILGGEKERIQVFEGMVIARKGATSQGATFTVRKVSDGIGVERIFPLYSPIIKKIEIVKQARVRRAKLYYLRDYKKRLKEVSVK